MDKVKIYNLVILDESGSMDDIYREALTGVNETVQAIQQAQKEHEELEQYLTLASFNAGEHYLSRKYDALPISDCKGLTMDDYHPSSGTALYDAMGVLISELQQKITHKDMVLVTVITDGYENSSKIWEGKQLKGLVEELSQMGWTFTYIGANQDLYEIRESLGITNTLDFCADDSGTSSMFRKERKARGRYYNRLQFRVSSLGESKPDMQTLDYFAEDEDSKPTEEKDNKEDSSNTKNESVKPEEPEQEPLVPRNWLYYPLLLVSFLVIVLMATGLGLIFGRDDTFIEGMTGIGWIFVWGLKGTLKAATSKGVGFKPILMYCGTIFIYCGFLACLAYWGILFGVLMFVIFLAMLWLTYKLFSSGNKATVILLALLIFTSIADAKKLHFQNIPIEGDVTVIHTKLKAKGCRDIKKDKMYYLMKGTYMGESAYYELSFNPETKRVLYLSIYLSQPSDAAKAGLKAMKIMKQLHPIYGDFDNYGSYWGVQLEDGGVCVNSEKQMGKMMLKVSFIRDELATGYINGEYDKYLK